MKKVLSLTEAITKTKQLQKAGKVIVLAGGCFDILHLGHISFLQEAKKHGKILMVMVEHDEQIKKWKGPNRPINTQETRAKILAQLPIVDYVILLPPLLNNEQYDELVIQIKPAIIATTAGDPYRHHKERQAKKIGATVVDVLTPVKNQSTTRFVSMLKNI